MQQGENIPTNENTFGGGMFKDTSFFDQPHGTYRDARNFQLINNDGNNFTLKDSQGNRMIFELPLPIDSTGPIVYGTPSSPIGFISFPDKLIVFDTYDDTANGGYGRIGVLYLTNIGGSVEQDPQTITTNYATMTFNGYVPLYTHKDLDFSRMYKVEGFAFPENNAIQRVYWSDYFNEPRVLNTEDAIFLTYIDDNALVVGVQYMVVSGAVTHNAVDYGFGLATGTVFTAVGANFTALTADTLVIEYYDIALLNWTPDRLLGDIHFDSFGTGSCYCGNRMYFYRLKSTVGGFQSSWSYGSFPVHVGKDQDPLPIIDSQHHYVGAGSLTTLVNSGKSVKIKIDNIDLRYDTIEVACAEFDQDLEVPYDIKIVISTLITATEMTLEDFGSNNLGALTIDDITLFPATILKCKTITTNKNYNVIANISEREEFDVFDVSGVVLSDYVYQIPTDNDSLSCSNVFAFGNASTGINPSITSNPSLVGGIEHATRWLVTVGTAEYPTGSGTLYNTGEVFIGDNALVNYQNWAQNTVGAQIRPATFLKQYTPQNNTNQRYDIIQFQTDTGWDYRNPAVASLAKGYRSSEKYRIGILFFDKKGNPFYVRWINDHTFDSIYTKDGLLQNQGNGVTDWWVLQSNILNVSNLAIPESIYTKIDGFSIVRAECDPSIITQGLCWQTQMVATVPQQIYPLPMLRLGAGNGYNDDPTNHIYSYICPDDLVSETYTKSKIVNVGDRLKVAGWLDTIEYSAGAVPTGCYYKAYSGGNKDWASKMYKHVDASNVNFDNSSDITNYVRVTEAQAVINFLPNVDFVNDYSYTGNPTDIIDQTCPGGGYANTTYTTYTGGRKIAIKTTDDLQNYNQTQTYSDGSGANALNQYKCLVNYVVNNNNQYGGTGDSALSATTYISTGHYQKIDSTVIADNLTVILGENYLVFDNIQVGGGDTFVCLIDYGYGLWNDSFIGNAGPYGGPPNIQKTPGSYGILFPCECRANYNLRRGRKVSDFGMANETYGVTYNGGSGANLGLEDFSYNNGYSSEGDAFKYPALPINVDFAGRFPYRIRWAGQKFIGEQLDSFRVFLVNDYRDVNGQLGEINNVRPKGDYVYYWQNHGVGSVPILERQLVSGSSGSATALGTGGVITRFDIISPKFGNQHQHGLTDTEEGWIWFDMRNKDICIMSLNGGVAEITVPTGMKSYFNEIFLERLTLYYNGTYLNSQTYDISSDRPLIGTGIVGVYDPKNKMTYITFKFKSWYQTALDPGTIDNYQDYQILAKDFTVGYSHILGKFVGFYDKVPAIWHNHNQSVLSANDPKNPDVYYAADMVVPTPVTKGMTIGNVEGEFIFTADDTISVYPIVGNPNLTQINAPNEIYVDNEEKPYTTVIEGYQYNMFYGKVVNNEVTFVINPKTNQAFAVDNALDVGNSENFTDFYYSNQNQSSVDNNVKSWNRNYQLIDEGWYHNLPISTSGKLSGFYTAVRYFKKNWDTSPITLTKGVKLLQKVISYFKLKF